VGGRASLRDAYLWRILAQSGRFPGDIGIEWRSGDKDWLYVPKAQLGSAFSAVRRLQVGSSVKPEGLFEWKIGERSFSVREVRQPRTLESRW